MGYSAAFNILKLVSLTVSTYKTVRCVGLVSKEYCTESISHRRLTQKVARKIGRKIGRKIVLTSFWQPEKNRPVSSFSGPAVSWLLTSVV